MPPLRGQILHKPHGLKLKAGQLSKGNGMGVGKGGGVELCYPKKRACVPSWQKQQLSVIPAQLEFELV